ncbi:hypothetical protein XHV734_2168 [Xanthomonas hortorum pv. vitians]|nr:hypothetical protein XHV734_2168 [Xanthomonas hortorum pv. vitians]
MLVGGNPCSRVARYAKERVRMGESSAASPKRTGRFGLRASNKTTARPVLGIGMYPRTLRF